MFLANHDAITIYCSTKTSDLTIGKLSARSIDTKPSSSRSSIADDKHPPSSSRPSARSSQEKDATPSSSRSNPASTETSRSQNIETYRTYMDTGRYMGCYFIGGWLIDWLATRIYYIIYLSWLQYCCSCCWSTYYHLCIIW